MFIILSIGANTSLCTSERRKEESGRERERGEEKREKEEREDEKRGDKKWRGEEEDN